MSEKSPMFDKSAPSMFCRGCDYVLNHLETPRCPECGQAFDPADPRSFRNHPRRRLSRRGGWLAFGVGATVGLCAPIIYLMAGGSVFLTIPTWAVIVFYPGFFTGYQAYDLFHSSVLMGEAVGILTVSLCYGVAAWFLYIVVASVNLWRATP